MDVIDAPGRAGDEHGQAEAAGTARAVEQVASAQPARSRPAPKGEEQEEEAAGHVGLGHEQDEGDKSGVGKGRVQHR